MLDDSEGSLLLRGAIFELLKGVSGLNYCSKKAFWLSCVDLLTHFKEDVCVCVFMYMILSFFMLRDRLTLTCYVIQISLEFEQWSPCLSYRSAEIIGMSHHISISL